MDFDKESLCEGAQYVNPALFSNTVINSPASQVSLRFKIKGLNATIATGWTASLEALRYAFDFLRQGRLKVVLAGGVEEMCLQLFAGFYKSGCLAGLKESEVELSCPFDKRRNGIILGEGSAMLVLEDYDAALSRQAQIYAEVKGFGRGFGEGGLKKSMGGALKSSRLLPEDIDCIFAAANSTEELDRLEACSIKETFPQRPPVSAIKSMLGEGYSSAGALQAAAAVAALKKGFIAPTINYRDSDASCDLNIVANEALAAEPKNILINACYPGKASSSLVISTFKG
jgi:3-oxoacyl-[acyl-carrier-protein] synthase II